MLSGRPSVDDRVRIERIEVLDDVNPMPWVLFLNDMRWPKYELLGPVAIANSKEDLRRWLDAHTVPSYTDGQWDKTFAPGSPLEWMNAPSDSERMHYRRITHPDRIAQRAYDVARAGQWRVVADLWERLVNVTGDPRPIPACAPVIPPDAFDRPPAESTGDPDVDAVLASLDPDDRLMDQLEGLAAETRPTSGLTVTLAPEQDAEELLAAMGMSDAAVRTLMEAGGPYPTPLPQPEPTPGDTSELDRSDDV